MALPLSIVFSKSMKEGAVPEDWRTTNVTPIFKKGSRTNPSNYRPVSLTFTPGKVMESLVKNTMMDFLNRIKLIRKSQHGFKPSKSCTTNLLEFLEVATRTVDEGNNLDVVYLDFSKAFDLVPRKWLLSKLKAHGFGGPLLHWIDKWLTDQKQRIVLNGKASAWAAVKSGVPQGSILGPILFAFFINDLEDDIDITVLVKFTEDTKLGQEIKSREDCEQLQSALIALERWAARWGMRFNTDKCHVLHIGRTNGRWDYTLAKVESERDIGVLVSTNLKTSEQCYKAANIATAVLGQILRAFSYQDKTVLPKLFVQYVRPHRDFAVQAW